MVQKRPFLVKKEQLKIEYIVSIYRERFCSYEYDFSSEICQKGAMFSCISNWIGPWYYQNGSRTFMYQRWSRCCNDERTSEFRSDSEGTRVNNNWWSRWVELERDSWCTSHDSIRYVWTVRVLRNILSLSLSLFLVTNAWDVIPPSDTCSEQENQFGSAKQRCLR